MWLAAWKLVSNDAKRTVAPPNAKHSTLLQGCFLGFLFLIPFTIRQQCTIYPQEFSTESMFFCSMGVVFFVERWGVIKKQFPRGWETAFAI